MSSEYSRGGNVISAYLNSWMFKTEKQTIIQIFAECNKKEQVKQPERIFCVRNWQMKQNILLMLAYPSFLMKKVGR